MGMIEIKIKNAFDRFKQDGNLQELVLTMARIGDYSIHCGQHAALMYDKIRKYCPPSIFECVYYDGEHGEYYLFDFNPNKLSNESIQAEVKSRLEHKIGIEPDYIDKAMESVYLININTMIKMR